MALKFAHICDLFDELEANQIRKSHTLIPRRTTPDEISVTTWLHKHRKGIYNDETSKLAVLSLVFPERRPDRVCALRERKLVPLLGACLGLGTERLRQLNLWQKPGHGDLASCLVRVMRQTETEIEYRVPEDLALTVNEVDDALTHVAAVNSFSSAKIKSLASAVSRSPREILRPIFHRMSAREAKWLIRLILKDLHPVVMPEQVFFRNFHFILPDLLRIYDSLEVAIGFLERGDVRAFPCQRPEDKSYARLLTERLLSMIVPEVGVKVSRKKFYKGRSMEQCCKMAGRRMMSVEKKYDGEYCQVHVDLESAYKIKLFSKNGKDATRDRIGVHEAIRKALQLGTVKCQVKKRCILEAEMVVFDHRQQQVAEFHKIRKHVNRSGRFIGTEVDSTYVPQPLLALRSEH